MSHERERSGKILKRNRKSEARISGCDRIIVCATMMKRRGMKETFDSACIMFGLELGGPSQSVEDDFCNYIAVIRKLLQQYECMLW
jgi:hypothetical protein